jgi:hypothetical protein
MSSDFAHLQDIFCAASKHKSLKQLILHTAYYSTLFEQLSTVKTVITPAVDMARASIAENLTVNETVYGGPAWNYFGK